MRISGFSFARNAIRLDYPIEESLRSVLPVVDELVVAIAPGGEGDRTREVVESIGDPRISILDVEWDEARGELAYSDLTNAAMDRCTGDWLLYIQADEVLHEEDHPVIRARCEELSGDRRVEGLLFDYRHFFGDYRHLQTGHGWYQREIRIVRAGIGVRSVRDAQSFRYPNQKRLTVARANARIFHYGWVRPPHRMEAKVREFWSHRSGSAGGSDEVGADGSFDYGPLGRLAEFGGTHPAVMASRIAAMDWGDQLRLVDGPVTGARWTHKDERWRYRVLSAFTRWTGIDLNHTNHGRVLDV